MSNDTSNTNTSTAIPNPITSATGAPTGAPAGSATGSAGAGSATAVSGGSASVPLTGSDPGTADGATPAPTATSIKQAGFDLLTSKKFLVTIAAIGMWIAGRIGLNADPQILDRIWVGLMVYVFGQGLADIGKGKVVAAARLGTGAAGLLLLCLIAPTLTACAALKSAEGPVEAAAIECTGVDLTPTIGDVQSKCSPDGTINNQCAEQVAFTNLKSAGDCLLIKLLDDTIGKLTSTSTTASSTSTQTASAAPHIAPSTRVSTTTTPPSQADVQRWRDTIEDFRAQHANGAKFRVDGVLR